MTVRELAAKSGCALDTIYRIEHQRGNSRLDTLDRLAAALSVELKDLLTNPLPESPGEVPVFKDRSQSRAERRRKEREEKQRMKRKRWVENADCQQLGFR